MNREELTALTIRLADCVGVSGNESAACAAALDILQKYTDNAAVINGNVIAHFGERSPSKPHVLIDAHIDRVGLIVTHITEEGFLKADTLGGLDLRILPAQRVTVHGKKDICGVICTLPPHLKSGGEKVLEKDNIYIDTGLSADRVRDIVCPGDGVSFDNPCHTLSGGRIAGAGLDDRCGMAAIIRALDYPGGNYASLPYSFTVMFSAQEELGERGACIGAFDIDPDISIAVDVSFAAAPGEDPKKCGAAGKGCMIGFAPSLDRELSRSFAELAEKNNIPFQYEVMNGTTGTNADRFSVNRGGSRAVTLSIPLRYMHTPSEVVDISDIESTAALIGLFIKGGA